MNVDTGSNTTALSEDDALRLGVPLERLELKPTGGVTGIAKRPYVANVDIWLLGGELRCVRVPEVMIWDTSTLLEQNKKGKMVQKAKGRGPSISILGMDVVRELRARLVLDTRTERGFLEW